MLILGEMSQLVSRRRLTIILPSLELYIKLTFLFGFCCVPRDVTEGCCKSGWEDSTNLADHGYRFCNYQAERMDFGGAVQRCQDNDMEQCDFRQMQESQAGICSRGYSRQIDRLPIYYHWTTSSCSVQVKVTNNGEIAIVHDPGKYKGVATGGLCGKNCQLTHTNSTLAASSS